MTIKVKKVSDNLYEASAVAAQWRGGEMWRTSEPLDGRSLVEQLTRRGFHVQDISDAIEEEDPDWVRKMDERQER